MYGHEDHFGHMTTTTSTLTSDVSFKILLHSAQFSEFVLRRCLKLLKYESVWLKVQEEPWPLVLKNLHIVFKLTV